MTVQPLRTMLKDLLSQYPKPIDLEVGYRGAVTRPFGQSGRQGTSAPSTPSK